MCDRSCSNDNSSAAGPSSDSSLRDWNGIVCIYYKLSSLLPFFSNYIDAFEMNFSPTRRHIFIAFGLLRCKCINCKANTHYSTASLSPVLHGVCVHECIHCRRALLSKNCANSNLNSTAFSFYSSYILAVICLVFSSFFNHFSLSSFIRC